MPVHPFAMTCPYIEQVCSAGYWVTDHPERTDSDEEKGRNWEPIRERESQKQEIGELHNLILSSEERIVISSWPHDLPEMLMADVTGQRMT